VPRPIGEAPDRLAPPVSQSRRATRNGVLRDRAANRPALANQRRPWLIAKTIARSDTDSGKKTLRPLPSAAGSSPAESNGRFGANGPTRCIEPSIEAAQSLPSSDRTATLDAPQEPCQPISSFSSPPNSHKQHCWNGRPEKKTCADRMPKFLPFARCQILWEHRFAGGYSYFAGKKIEQQSRNRAEIPSTIARDKRSEVRRHRAQIPALAGSAVATAVAASAVHGSANRSRGQVRANRTPAAGATR